MSFEINPRIAKIGSFWFNHNGWFKNNNYSNRLELKPLLRNEEGTSLTEPVSTHDIPTTPDAETSFIEESTPTTSSEEPQALQRDASTEPITKTGTDTVSTPTDGQKPSTSRSLPGMEVVQQVADVANAPTDYVANNYNIKQDSKIMGEYYNRMSGSNGTYLGMREHAQMIASARQSGRAYSESGRKLGATLGGVAGGLIGYFVAKHRYEKQNNDKYLSDYNFKTLTLGSGQTIDPRDHETSNFNTSKDTTYQSTNNSYKLGRNIDSYFQNRNALALPASSNASTQTDYNSSNSMELYLPHGSQA